MSDFKTIKILVAGNATIDQFVYGKFRSEGDRVTLICEGFDRTFDLVDPPFKTGYKHRIDVDVENAIYGLKTQSRPGGGGINLAISMFNRAPHETYLQINYVDMSQEHPLIREHLDNLGINYRFLGHRPVPVNIVMGTRDDKVTLKGPMLPRESLTDSDRKTIETLVEGSDVACGNGLKDDSLAKYMISASNSRNIPIFFLVTSSLERVFFEREVLPIATTIINQEDIFRYLGGNPQSADPNQMYTLSVEYVRSLVLDGKIRGYPLIVTMGSNGAIFWTKDAPLRHTKVNEETALKINKYHFSDTSRINGAGDTFAGEILMQSIQYPSRNITTMVERANKAALRRMGYEGQLTTANFKTTEIPIH